MADTAVSVVIVELANMSHILSVLMLSWLRTERARMLWQCGVLAGLLLLLIPHHAGAHQSRARTVTTTSAQVQLSAEERAYLQKIGPITVCPD